MFAYNKYGFKTKITRAFIPMVLGCSLTIAARSRTSSLRHSCAPMIVQVEGSRTRSVRYIDDLVEGPSGCCFLTSRVRSTSVTA